MTSSTQTTTTASTLSDAERVRLTRKDAQNRGIELERLLGKNLQAWYLIALNLERSQVAADRVGALIATTQQQSVPTPAAAAPPRVLDAKSTATPLPLIPTTRVVVKTEPQLPLIPTTLAVVKTEPSLPLIPTTPVVVVKVEPPTSNDMDVDFFNETASDDFF